MKKKPAIVLAGVLIAGAGSAAFVTLSLSSKHAAAVSDPRQEAPIVRLATVASVSGSERAFTGLVAARVQSNLGFRVSGKIVERLVDVGWQVKAGQPLMRIDETDLRLALTAKRNAVIAARAVLLQAVADEKRYAALVKWGLAATPQRYEQAKAVLDTAQAQVAVAEAEADVAQNQANYSTLLAGTDGTVVATLGEPGQVIAAGQTVAQLAHAGPREAVVALPETIRPVLGAQADASIYGRGGQHGRAVLRQISDAADAQTRTYEARYVLEGDAASAPLGSTVTIRITSGEGQPEVAVPIGAVLDDGNRTGVWGLDRDSSTVRFVPIQIRRLNGESAVVKGVEPGQQIVAIGAHLLEDGARVRTNLQAEAAN